MNVNPIKIGPFKCTPIIGGRFKLDGGAMFGIVPRPLWKNVAPPTENNQIEMVMRTLLIERDSRKILVDCGIGNKVSEKNKRIFSVSPDSETMLADNLKDQAGLSPEDITDVIITHLHFDHAAGATTLLPTGKIVPTFPKAEYHLQKSHYDWVTSRHAREKASFWPENYEPLKEHNQLRFTDGDQTLLFDELRVLVSDGHTMGQQLPMISADGQTLVYCGDLIPMSAHIPLLWHMAYDIQPLVLLEEKENLLDEAVNGNYTLMFEHDPSVVTCRVEKTEKGYRIRK